MIRTVIRFPHNMVMVFDGIGEQIPKYQGQYDEVREIILEDTPPDAAFSYFSDYGAEFKLVSREDW